MNKLYVDLEDHPVVRELAGRLERILDLLVGMDLFVVWSSDYLCTTDKDLVNVLEALDCIEVLEEGESIAICKPKDWTWIYGHEAS